MSSRSAAQGWLRRAIRRASATCLKGLPHRLRMDNDATFCSGYKPPRVLGMLRTMSNSYAATSGEGEVEPEYSDASLFCVVGGTVDDTGSTRGGVGSEARIRFVSVNARLSNSNNCLATCRWISRPMIKNERERD
jgi:hypothetical protein